MDNKQIDEAIKHLQSSIKYRAMDISKCDYDIKYELVLAHKSTEDKEPFANYRWRDYHYSKDLRNRLVKEQLAEKSLLKLLYSLQNKSKVLVSLAQVAWEQQTKH